MASLKASLVAVSLFATSSVFAEEYTIDPAHTAATFSVRHMTVSTARGEFQKVTGTVNVDDKDVTKSAVDVSIDAASVNTRDSKRDEHLKSADFFDVQKYPNITFKSTRVAKGKAGKLKVTGDLTIHGVTKPVTLDVEKLTAAVKNPWGQTVRGFTASTQINRKDFGLTWNKALEAGGLLVGEEVSIQIDGELNPKPEKAAAIVQ